MATSNVSIVNQALGMIGQGRISALDDGSVPAIAANTIFESLRDEVLESYPWTFARGRASLSQDSEAPDFEFSYQYLLPADFLRMIDVDGDTMPTGDDLGNVSRMWAIEGNKLLTNNEEVNIRYIKRVTDASKFSPAFVSCLSARLAADLAMSVAKSPRLELEMYRLYQTRKDELMSLDGQNDREFFYRASSSYEDAR